MSDETRCLPEKWKLVNRDGSDIIPSSPPLDRDLYNRLTLDQRGSNIDWQANDIKFDVEAYMPGELIDHVIQ
jgi:hypothetical protein